MSVTLVSMPRFKVAVDPFEFDAASIQQVTDELLRVDPDSDPRPSFEMIEGVGSWFKLVAPSTDIAEQRVRDAATHAGVNPTAVRGAEADLAN